MGIGSLGALQVTYNLLRESTQLQKRNSETNSLSQ